MSAQPRSTRRLAVMAVAGVAVSVPIVTSLGFKVGPVPADAVVGGVPAAPGEAPWQVSLQGPNGHFCGGSLVSERVVVTAAHCVTKRGPGDFVVVAGINHLGETGVRVGVSMIGLDSVGDIAILTLDQPVALGGTVQAIPLAGFGDINSSTQATITGWGVTDENAQSTPDDMQTAVVPITAPEDCNWQTGANPSYELCAGRPGVDSCYGDSGGPLVVYAADGRPLLAGVVSRGDGCAGAKPGIYTAVPAFADWITGQIADPGSIGDPATPPTSDPGIPTDDTSVDPTVDPNVDPTVDPTVDGPTTEDPTVEDPSTGDDGSADEESGGDAGSSGGGSLDPGAGDDGTWEDGSGDDSSWDDGSSDCGCQDSSVEDDGSSGDAGSWDEDLSDEGEGW